MNAPTLPEIARVFGRIGLLSFGGPAAQIALMHRELVETRDWLSDRQFLGALSFCMLLPGPEAMQLATYAGWRLRGTAGGLLAGLLFVLPGAVVIAALAAAYVAFGALAPVQAAFLGVKAAVVIIVAQALQKVAARALTGLLGRALALAAFLAIFVAHLPFPLIIAAAALIGYVTARPARATSAPAIAIPPGATLRTVLLWSALWLAPLLLCWAIDARFLTEIALYFAQLAVITFGGAYAVLAWMAQTVVADYGWITAGQMIDALGLAETTPGPLILVTEFVGLLAGQAQGGLPLAALAGLLTLWMTFVPCFLWIFALSPYVDYLLEQPRLTGALHAITAAVVGVIANLSLWFALHVLFARIAPARIALLPDLNSFDATAAALVVLAAALLVGLRLGMIATLSCMALAGLAAGFLTGTL